MDNSLWDELAKQVPQALVLGGFGLLVFRAFLAHMENQSIRHAADMAKRDIAMMEHAKESRVVMDRASGAIEKSAAAIGENTAALREIYLDREIERRSRAG